MTRLDQLRRLADVDPNDPFVQYGLGLEYQQLERWDEARAAFERTLALDASYTAAYFQKARTELKLGARAAAAETLRSGVKVATARGETHTASEMNKLLETLT